MKKWLFGIPLGVLLLLVIYGASQMKSTPTGQQRYDLYFLSDSYTSGMLWTRSPARWTAKRMSSINWYTLCCPNRNAVN